MRPHVYEWAKKRGFFGRKGPASHLLLDGGVLSVPQDASAEFEAAYAIGIVRQRTTKSFPCVVEVKTPVFRMFYDLDILMKPAMATEFVRGDISRDAEPFLRMMCEMTLSFFPDVSRRVTVCASDAPKRSATGTNVKLGVHLTFDDVFVTSSTALAIRQNILDKLTDEPNPFENEWTHIVDIAVFKGSGMRLPWSGKKNESRSYVPICDYSDGTWTSLDHRAISASVSASRDLISRVSLRSFRQATSCTLALEPPDVDMVHTAFGMTHASLREFSSIIPTIQSAIPEMYDGQVTAVLRGDHAVIFRHSSRYCSNVERQHNSSNTYFLLTRRGLQQCCYSRKDEDVGRKYCLCRDFRGDHIPVPSSVTDELFPEEPTAPKIPSAMPSRTTVDIDTIARASRPKVPSKVKSTARPKSRKPLSFLLS